MDEGVVIEDKETIIMVERLAKLTNVSVEEAVSQALRESLLRLGIDPVTAEYES